MNKFFDFYSVRFVYSEEIMYLCSLIFNTLYNMILDKLENADLYFECVPRLENFVHFFNNNDLEELPPCKIKLDGDDLIVNILDFNGKDEGDCQLEAHKDYIDIQIPLGADEMMKWKAQVDCQDVLKDYDEGEDVEFYSDKAETSIVVPKGYFVVFFPSDAHAPGIAAGQTYRKVIVKTKVQ